MTNPKILVLGYGRHGKDTAAEFLLKLYGLRFVSSSLFAASRVMMPYFEKLGVYYNTVGDCYDDRHRAENRAIWYDQIVAYNTPDPARLAREILSESDLYVGMRSEHELAAAKDLFDHVLWVDSTSRGIPPEPKSSMTIEFDPNYMRFIDNKAGLSELEEEIRKVGSEIKLSELVA